MYSKVLAGGLSFNDNPNYVITAVQGLGLPPVLRTSSKVAGEHFGISETASYNPRQFSLSGMVIGATVADLETRREVFSSAFDIIANGLEQAIDFTLPSGLVKRITAGLTGQPSFDPSAELVNACTFNLPFEAAFPFLVSATGSSQSIGLATIGGGTVPATVPLSLSANTGGSLYASNVGSAPAYLTARIAGAVPNPGLRNNTTGKELRLNLTLAAGEYVDIDFKRKTITDNYGTNRFDKKTGDWWTLAKGVNEIRFVSDTYDAGALATLTWQSTYLIL